MTDEFDFDDAKAAFLEEMYRTPAMVERRSRVRAALDPERGADVLCIGPGPGYEPAELGDSVGPDGAISTVDVSAPMLELTKDRCEPRPPVTAASGSAEALPYRENAFDAVTSVQVFEYLDGVERALEELARVLRPGGRAVVVATDWRTLVWAVDDEQRAGRVLRAYEDHCVNPRLGSRLGRLVGEEPGLRTVSVEPYSILQRSVDGDSFGRYFTELVAEYVRDHGSVSEATVDAWRADVQRREDAGETFLGFTQYLYTVAPVST